MKKILPLLTLIAILAGLTACSLFSDPNPNYHIGPYKNAMYGWLGRPVKELIAQWGQPARTGSLSTGQKTYTWVWPLNPKEAVYVGDKGQKTAYESCQATVATNSKGIISNFDPTLEDQDVKSFGCGFLQPAPSAYAAPASTLD